MSQAKCPSCGFAFDNHREGGTRSLRGRLLFGPERLIATAKRKASDMDLCPNCGTRFVSEEFAIFGKFARARLQSVGAVYAVVGLVVVAMIASFWMISR
jgi:rubredoxin